MAEWSKASPTDQLIVGSNPIRVFLIFFENFPNFKGQFLSSWQVLAESDHIGFTTMQKRIIDISDSNCINLYLKK